MSTAIENISLAQSKQIGALLQKQPKKIAAFIRSTLAAITIVDELIY